MRVVKRGVGLEIIQSPSSCIAWKISNSLSIVWEIGWRFQESIRLRHVSKMSGAQKILSSSSVCRLWDLENFWEMGCRFGKNVWLCYKNQWKLSWEVAERKYFKIYLFEKKELLSYSVGKMRFYLLVAHVYPHCEIKYCIIHVSWSDNLETRAFTHLVFDSASEISHLYSRFLL